MAIRIFLGVLLLTGCAVAGAMDSQPRPAAASSAAPAQPAPAPPVTRVASPASAASAVPAVSVTTRNVAVLTSDQVLQVLDRTVDWYRMLGTQQQWSSQPSDLLILYANQQIANEVVNLAFDLARANAELLSSEADSGAPSAFTTAAQDSNAQSQKMLEDQRRSIQAELASLHSSASARADELHAELDMVNARLNLLKMMSVFVDQSNARRASANALKEHIDAIAASIPGVTAGSGAAPSPSGPGGSTSRTTGALTASAGQTTANARSGLWEMISNSIALARKRSTIVAIDQDTAALQQMISGLRSAPMSHLQEMSRQSDVLAQRADAAQGSELKQVRAQLDTLAWLFQQTSAMLVPLIKEAVLLDQYRRNLSSWHDIATRQYHEAVIALIIRLAILAAVLALVFAAGEVWRRMVVRYAPEPRRRQQLLLIRKLTLTVLVLLIIGLSFFTQLGSFATFAGLITAGVAVAMQSVLTCVVGYFLLIGRYGLRVGDRVQVGNVTGEIIELGLIRMHLMELAAEGKLGPTGRIVALPNSIVFQATGGLFRQVPGSSLVWHEISISLPPDRDYPAFKRELLPLLEEALKDYQAALREQSRATGQSTSTVIPAPHPQVQLRLAGSGAEVVVRYPVQTDMAAEIDEKIADTLRRLMAQPSVAAQGAS